MEAVDWLEWLELISWSGAVPGSCCGFVRIQMLMLVVWIVRNTERF